MKKRILAGVVAVVMAFTMMPQMAFAEEKVETSTVAMEGVLSNGELLAENSMEAGDEAQNSNVSNSVATYALENNNARSKSVSKNKGGISDIISDKEFEKIVGVLSDLSHVGSSAKQVTVNVKGYGITTDNIIGVVAHIFNCSPELFYYEKQYRYMYSGKNVLSITFEFNDSVSAIKEQVNKVNREVKKFDQLVEPGMTDEDLTLLVHDYLAVNTVYDVNYDSNRDESIFDIYGVFGDKEAVCQGYALAAEYLLNRHGVNCGIASSEKANHAWNIVEIDDKWYHMDVTWDDPIYDNLGRVHHQYLLISDQELLAGKDGEKKKDYITSDLGDDYQKANDKSFNNAFWKKSKTMIHYYNDDWYYMEAKNFKLNKYDKDTNKSYKVVDNSDMKEPVVWKVLSNPKSHWSENYSRVVGDGSNLYFSTPKEIYCVDLDNSKRKPYSVYNIGDINKQIYGLGMFQNVLLYVLKESPHSNVSEFDNDMIYSANMSAACKTNIYKVETGYNQITLSYNPVNMVYDDGSRIPMEYRIYYKKNGDKKYHYINTDNTKINIGNLLGNYKYSVKLRPYYVNKDGETVFGQMTGVMEVVTNPLNRFIPRGKINKISFASPSKVTVNVDQPVVKGGKTSCQLAYKKSTDKKFKIKNFSGTSVSVSNLEKNSTYQFKLRYLHTDNKSGNKAFSRYSPIKTVKTK